MEPVFEKLKLLGIERLGAGTQQPEDPSLEEPRRRAEQLRREWANEAREESPGPAPPGGRRRRPPHRKKGNGGQFSLF